MTEGWVSNSIEPNMMRQEQDPGFRVTVLLLWKLVSVPRYVPRSSSCGVNIRAPCLGFIGS